MMSVNRKGTVLGVGYEVMRLFKFFFPSNNMAYLVKRAT